MYVAARVVRVSTSSLFRCSAAKHQATLPWRQRRVLNQIRALCWGTSTTSCKSWAFSAEHNRIQVTHWRLHKAAAAFSDPNRASTACAGQGSYHVALLLLQRFSPPSVCAMRWSGLVWFVLRCLPLLSGEEGEQQCSFESKIMVRECVSKLNALSA